MPGIYRFDIFELTLKKRKIHILPNVLRSKPCNFHIAILDIGLWASLKSVFHRDLLWITSETHSSDQCLKLWAKVPEKVSKNNGKEQISQAISALRPSYEWKKTCLNEPDRRPLPGPSWLFIPQTRFSWLGLDIVYNHEEYPNWNVFTTDTLFIALYCTGSTSFQQSKDRRNYL